MGSKFHKLAAVVLTAVAAPACSDPAPATDYGEPYAIHVVTGIVYAEFDQQPIEGIEVQIATGTTPVYTGSDGTFDMSQNAPPCRPSCELTVTDVDGAAMRGEFVSQSVELTMAQTAKPTDAWGDGTWEAHGIQFVLDRVSGGGGSGATGQGGGGATGGAAGSGGGAGGGGGG